MVKYAALITSDVVSHLGDSLALPALVLALHIAVLVQLTVIAAYLVTGFSCKVSEHRPDVHPDRYQKRN